MKLNIKNDLMNYKTYLILLLFLTAPAYTIKMFDVHLAWFFSKNTKIIKQDKFYSNRIKSLPKSYTTIPDKIIFLNNFGKIINTLTRNKNIIITGFPEDKGIIIYTSTGGDIKYINGSGIKEWEYKTYAYPFVINEDLILLVTGENAGFKIIDRNKNELSEFKATGSIALSFDADKKNHIAIGFSNGTLCLYNSSLTLLWSKNFIFGSIYPIIKKVSLSAQGNYIAVLSGLKDEYIYILNSKGEKIFEYKTGENRRRSIDLKFSKNEKYLLEESDTGFRLYSVTDKKLLLSKKLFNKKSNRQLISMDISKNGKFILIAYKFNKESTIIDLYNTEGVLLYREFMKYGSLPFIKFSSSDNSFIIETTEGFYVYEI